jgi:hypothetical protein
MLHTGGAVAGSGKPFLRSSAMRAKHELPVEHTADTPESGRIAAHHNIPQTTHLRMRKGEKPWRHPSGVNDERRGLL